MAEIAPFRGIVYDSAKGEIAKLIAPPYDVIGDEERAMLAAQSPKNIVHVDLPRGPAGEKEGDDRYPEAAKLFESWLAEGTLRPDEAPTLYRYHQLFALGGREYTRRGFIALVRLTPFAERVVLPHERTLSGPKIDRLKLMRATRAHFSQVFGLYEDAAGRVDETFAATDEGAVALEGRTADGVLHRLFCLTDADTIRQVVALLAPSKIYVADGHHRYETMIALRDELRAANPKAPAGSSIHFGPLFLMNASDPGLVVLPTHRLAHGLASFDLEDLARRAKDQFAVSAFPLGDRRALAEELRELGAKRPTFAVVGSGTSAAYLFSLRPGGEAAMERRGVAPALAGVDVAVLHTLVLEGLCGIDRAAQESQTNLRYVKDLSQGIDAVATGEAQAAFLMNPTRVEQVIRAADAGCVMPQKSTFFYPKIASGLVLSRIAPDEAVGVA